MTNDGEEPFVWTIPEEFPEELIGTYDRGRSPDRFEYRKGEPVHGVVATPVFVYPARLEDLEVWDVLPNDAQLPLVSPRVVAVLRSEAAADCQLLDAVVEHRDGAAKDGWKLLNVTTAVQAIDHETSEYSLVPGTKQILAFRKLRYRPDALGQVKIARDAEYKSHLLVSPTLAAVLVGAGVRGLALVRAEEMGL